MISGGSQIWRKIKWPERHTEIFVCGKRVDCAGSVLLVDLIKPCNASCVVLWSRLPVLTAYER